jgi:hypothetical protein
VKFSGPVGDGEFAKAFATPIRCFFAASMAYRQPVLNFIAVRRIGAKAGGVADLLFVT